MANERYEQLMAIQQQVAFDWLEGRIGTSEPILIDSPLPDQPGVWIGRSRSEAPDIDGVVIVSGFDDETEVAVGDMIQCEIVAADGYDLIAAPVAG